MQVLLQELNLISYTIARYLWWRVFLFAFFP
nr:MAG TPA: hypothetical protein [Caudoviricetes sp.]